MPFALSTCLSCARRTVLATAFVACTALSTAVHAQFEAPPPQAITHGSFRYEYPDAGDRFGTRLATADFDADGITDLAVGAPGDRFVSFLNAGTVAIALGHTLGLQTFVEPSQRQFWNLVPDAEAGDRFGWAIATGDFNRDGYDDLAVGAPYEDSSASDAGVVSVFYGGRDGLRWDNIQDLGQGRSGIDGSPEYYDRFGWALAAGDFNGDGYDDLAVGVPSETFSSGSYQGEGAIQVFFGSGFGLNLAGDDFVHQSEIANGGDSENGDEFGAALAAGDFNHDGYDDLAIGVPKEDLSGVVDCGAVTVVMGSAAGLNKSRGVILWQNGTSTLGAAESWDRFGSILATGDLNGDGFEELHRRCPGRGRRHPRRRRRHQPFSRLTLGPDLHRLALPPPERAGVPDDAETGDRFGQSVLVARLQGTTYGDLLVGVSGENGTGAYQRFRSGSSGLAPTSGQLFFQPGIGARESGDEFGGALAFADFNHNGYGEVAAAAPGETYNGAVATGQVDVVYTAPPQVIGWLFP